MPTAIEFTLDVRVLPKQSGRVRRGGMYTARRVKENQRAIALLAKPHAPRKPLVGPLRLELCFHVGTSDYRRCGAAYKDTKPDLDNLTKPVADALQAAGFFRNDGQVAQLQAEKMWAPKDNLQVRIVTLRS